MSKNPPNKVQKYKAEDLIDEFTDYSEKKSSININARIISVIQYLQDKQISAQSNQEIGDLLATIAEVIPPMSNVISNFCDSIASICVDRDYVSFSDEALTTLVSILIKRVNEPRADPSPILRALSSVLYHNTLRLKAFHEEIINICTQFSTVSDECYKRCLTCIGNIAASSQKQLDKTIYTRAVKFLMGGISSNNIELMKPALRSLQLLVLDAPKQTFDLQLITHTLSKICFSTGQVNLRFEALMLLKALANVTGTAFYPQWPLLLTNQQSLFDLLKQNVKLAKTTADLLADMFRGAYNYMYIANNIDPVRSFTTLASQIGEIIDVCFQRFFVALERGPKTDNTVWSKIAKAFSVFVKDVSFDSGRLKQGYLTRVVQWAQQNIGNYTEESLLVLKSLLWTSIENQEFHDSFDFIFNSFLQNLVSPNQDIAKSALQAFRRIAYAYSAQCVERWDKLGPTLCRKELGPTASFQILIRLAENHVEALNIWQEILTTHVPLAFKANNQAAIQLALQCIGQCGFIFSKLEDGIQRQCLATVLSNDNDCAYEAIGSLSLSSAPEYSTTFLCDGYRKLISAVPPRLKPLSKVLKAFATQYKDQFVEAWCNDLFKVINDTKSPYQPKCLAYLLPFIKDEGIKNQILDFICTVLENGSEASWRWKAAAALAEASSFGVINHTCVVKLFESLRDSKSPKLKVRTAQALSSLSSRTVIGDLFSQCMILSIDYLVENAHFTFLKKDEQRKLDSALREALTKFLFNLLRWAVPSDFNAIEESLVTNSEQLYNIMCNYPDAPWESITTLYELKFKTIPTDLLEKFQAKAFQ